MRNAAFLILILLSLISAYTSVAKTPASTDTRQRLPLVTGLPNSVSWSDSQQDSSDIALHFRLAPIRPVKLLIRRDHPNGSQVLALYNVPDAVNLLEVATKPGNAKIEADAFDGYGDLKPGCSIQAGEWDYRQGNIPLIVIAIGTGKGQVGITVLKYHPPLNRKNLPSPKNWEDVGSCAGNAPAAIHGEILSFPDTGNGHSTKYALANGRLKSVLYRR